MVTLANKTISFGCKITYPYTPEYKSFKISYFYVDRETHIVFEKPITCQPSKGKENQTHRVECPVTPQLQNASATGTYYCRVQWPSITMAGNGTFILVRDSGYREPRPGSQKALLLGFTGLLTALSVLGTALLVWKKKQMQVPAKQLASSSKQSPRESVYTALQRRETEVYAFIKSEANSPPSERSPLSQEELYRSKEEEEFGLVYENL
ncbi:NFAT activation molecule 1 [Orycteropus afer afer]|uniref:NFAT activation molecule 1 n=1 Tax=Orycteropus afer afer TaxID=1230840 RepID=A0A8B6ZW89_ORYAF|nr:NFAT activation molecule 1 [Orycteropus afer afer]